MLRIKSSYLYNGSYNLEYYIHRIVREVEKERKVEYILYRSRGSIILFKNEKSLKVIGKGNYVEELSTFRTTDIALTDANVRIIGTTLIID